MTRRERLIGLVTAAALSLASCSPGEEGKRPTDDGAGGQGLVVQVASYELVAGRENRFIAGLLTEDNLFVSGGTVNMRFSTVQGEGASTGELFFDTEGRFLHIDEGHGPPPSRVTVGPASIGRGVYAAEAADFAVPGTWQVEVEANLGGGDRRTATGAFQVLERPRVPAPGQKAPPTENHTAGSKDVPAVAIDSRAETAGGIPDPEMHKTTIAAAIEAGRPAVVVFSTPVYCVSRFCGPITDMVGGLARKYGDRAAFIHVEIWRDFQNKVVNKAAAEWILRDDDLTEPWIFLIGDDGRIVSRWDNVATPGEIEPFLKELPVEAANPGSGGFVSG